MRLYSVLVAAAVATAAMISSAHAESISTGVADWKLLSIDNFGSPASIPGQANVGNSAPTITPNGAWGSTPSFAATDASWIGASTDGAQHGVWGWYTFELTLTNLAPGQYTVDGFYSADNMVDSFKINGAEQLSGLPVASPSPIYGFNFTYNFSALANSPITITARIYNESVVSPFQGYPTGPNPTNGMDNPLGFILAGSVNRTAQPEVVPTPAAAFGGFTLLSGLALTQLRRRAKQAD